MPETPYIEANLILAEQAGDTELVDTMIDELYPNERVELAAACSQLASKLRLRDGIV
jgi:hypothetical protein